MSVPETTFILFYSIALIYHKNPVPKGLLSPALIEFPKSIWSTQSMSTSPACKLTTKFSGLRVAL